MFFEKKLVHYNFYSDSLCCIVVLLMFRGVSIYLSYDQDVSIPIQQKI